MVDYTKFSRLTDTRYSAKRRTVVQRHLWGRKIDW